MKSQQIIGLILAIASLILLCVGGGVIAYFSNSGNTYGSIASIGFFVVGFILLGLGIYIYNGN